jgi:hypothetical protein
MPTPQPIRAILFEAFFLAYKEAAYFTEGGPDHPEFDKAEMSEECLAKIKETCACFFDKVYDEHIHGRREAKRFGHEFWLSRNGHGSGFFDCDIIDEEATRDSLQLLACSFGRHDLYVGDDGLIYSDQK